MCMRDIIILYMTDCECAAILKRDHLWKILSKHNCCASCLNHIRSVCWKCDKVTKGLKTDSSFKTFWTVEWTKQEVFKTDILQFYFLLKCIDWQISKLAYLHYVHDVKWVLNSVGLSCFGKTEKWIAQTKTFSQFFPSYKTHTWKLLKLRLRLGWGLGETSVPCVKV